MILESEYFEDENEDLVVIETMKKVKCKVLQKGYKQTTMYYYICSCDPKQRRPICEECAVVCHAGHKLSERYMGEQVCSCGKKNHKVTETPQEDNSYDPKCVFNELSKHSKLNIYYTDSKITACMFCKSNCFDQIAENDWKMVVDENLLECSCPGHPIPKVILGNVSGTTGINPTQAAALATKKPFDIKHPTKEGWRLRHVCVEGPTADVYVRGVMESCDTIELPDYWTGLVDSETITISLTAVGEYQELFAKLSECGTKVKVSNALGEVKKYSYLIFGERKDVERNIAEYEGESVTDYPGDNAQYGLFTL